MKKRKPNYWLDCEIRIRKGMPEWYNHTWYSRKRFFSADSDKEAIEKSKDIIERKALRLKNLKHKIFYAELNRRDPDPRFKNMWIPVWSKKLKKIIKKPRKNLGFLIYTNARTISQY